MAEGDGGAVRACLAQYGGLVWTLTRRAGFAGAEAEDAVQEVFAELWRCGGRFDPAIASETAFVAMIARRRLVDRRRRLARRPDGASLDEAITGMAAAPAAAEGLGDEAVRAAAALQELSPEQQRVLRLSVYEGLSHESISRATGLPLGTVKTHVRRALMRLREALGVPQTAGGGA